MPVADFSHLVTNPRMKKVLSDCGHLDSSTLGNGYELKLAVYKHCCTSGPTTWYKKGGVHLYWWNGKGPKGATVEDMKASLQKSGMVAVYHCGGLAAKQEFTRAASKSKCRPGDVGSMISASSAHGVMWTGEDWRSDCIERDHPYPYSQEGRGGDWSFILWRHPDLQEPGVDIMGGGFGNTGSSGGGGGSAVMKDFNIESYEVKEDEQGKYTEEPVLIGVANHIHLGGSGTTGATGSGVTGEFGAGKEPIPSGFYPDKVLWHFLSHAEGKVAVMWTTGRDSRTPVTAEGAGGYDYPGGVHSKNLVPEGWNIDRLGITWTDRGRTTLLAEGKGTGARWGWYSTPITPEHPWWVAIMPTYRDAMIWAWNNVDGIQSVKDPAARLCSMHAANWGRHHCKRLIREEEPGYAGRYKKAQEACSYGGFTSNFP